MPTMILMRQTASGDELNAPGEYRIVRNQEKEYPVIVCPGCKHAVSCSKHTMQSRDPLTIRASFLCGCGWHGWITEGTMVEWTAEPTSVRLPSGALLDPSTGKVTA